MAVLIADNHGAVGAGAVLVEYAQVNQVRLRRDSLEGLRVVRTSRTRAISGDQSCNVRAVTILIVPAGVPGNEALTPYHARQSEQSAVQIRMAADTAVDHRDSHTSACVTRLPCGKRIHRRRSIAEGWRQRSVKTDVSHIRLIRRAKECSIRGRSATIAFTSGSAFKIEPSVEQKLKIQQSRLAVVLHDDPRLRGRRFL